MIKVILPISTFQKKPFCHSYQKQKTCCGLGNFFIDDYNWNERFAINFIYLLPSFVLLIVSPSFHQLTR